MDNGYTDPDIDDLFNDQTDQTTSPSTTSSSSQGPFVRNEQFILELHELKRDSASTGNPEQKIKKLKKKKKAREAKAKGASSSSPSEGSLQPHSDVNKEEFYDAHESYHGLAPDTQLATPIALANPMVGAIAVQEGPDPKLVLSTNPGLPVAAARNAKATSKPVPPIDKT